MNKGCDTCKHFDYLEGECKKHIATQWESRDCDTSNCTEYKYDSFYEFLEEE